MSLEDRIKSILNEGVKPSKTEDKTLDEAFTRQHYQQIAKVVSSMPDAKSKQEAANAHAKMFAADNPRFDASKFHAACGTKHGMTEAEDLNAKVTVGATPDPKAKEETDKITKGYVKAKAEELKADDKTDVTDPNAKEETDKITKGYVKAPMEKLKADDKADVTDAKAKEETDKIEAKYVKAPMEKLKAEAFEALFTGETLSEDFKVKATAIFEAAVEQVTDAKIEEIQEAHQVELKTAIDEAKEEIVGQIDEYLNFVIEEWMQENKLAIESGQKLEAAEAILTSMKQVFEQHNIDVPTSELDVVAEQYEEIETLKSELDAAKDAKQIAESAMQVMECDAVIAEHSKGLSIVQSEKLQALSENVEFESKEDFSAKVKALKEAYLTKVDEKVTKETIKEDKSSNKDVAAVLRALKNDDAMKFINIDI